jgi:hypothetical protein
MKKLKHASPTVYYADMPEKRKQETFDYLCHRLAVAEQTLMALMENIRVVRAQLGEYNTLKDALGRVLTPAEKWLAETK